MEGFMPNHCMQKFYCFLCKSKIQSGYGTSQENFGHRHPYDVTTTMVSGKVASD